MGIDGAGSDQPEMRRPSGQLPSQPWDGQEVVLVYGEA